MQDGLQQQVVSRTRPVRAVSVVVLHVSGRTQVYPAAPGPGKCQGRRVTGIAEERCQRTQGCPIPRSRNGSSLNI